MAALAFLTSVAFTGVAHAQEQTYRISVGDLDLTSGKDKARFDQRVDGAARQLCESLSPSVMHDYHYYDLCFQAVRKEANDDLQQVLHGDSPRLAAIVLRYGAL